MDGPASLGCRRQPAPHRGLADGPQSGTSAIPRLRNRTRKLGQPHSARKLGRPGRRQAEANSKLERPNAERKFGGSTTWPAEPNPKLGQPNSARRLGGPKARPTEPQPKAEPAQAGTRHSQPSPVANPFPMHPGAPTPTGPATSATTLAAPETPAQPLRMKNALAHARRCTSRDATPYSPRSDLCDPQGGVGPAVRATRPPGGVDPPNGLPHGRRRPGTC
jgi:hypothetical protein